MLQKFPKPKGAIKYDSLKKRTDISILCANFYLLTAMLNIAENKAAEGNAFLKSREKILEDIRSEQGECAKNLENLFLAYFPYAVYSELQNTDSIAYSSEKPEKTVANLMDSIQKNIDADIGEEVKKIAPTCEKAKSFFLAAKAAFGQLRWKSGFGGKKWAQIADTALMRLNGEIDSIIFIDTAFNIQHHSGHIFDKHEKIDCSDTDLNNILNIKRDSSLGKMRKLTKKYASPYVAKLFARGESFDWWQEEPNK